MRGLVLWAALKLQVEQRRDLKSLFLRNYSQKGVNWKNRLKITITYWREQRQRQNSKPKQLIHSLLPISTHIAFILEGLMGSSSLSSYHTLP